MRVFVNATLITLTLMSASPSLSGTYGDAADYTRRALLQTEEVKTSLKRLERYANNSVLPSLGMDKADLIYFAWALPIASGKVSTKPFRKLAVSTESWIIQPEIEYEFSGENKFNGMLVFQYKWE